MRYPVDWVDAFSDRPFGGNGCAVVYDDGALADDTCLSFVRETGLSECNFVGPSNKADWRVRYFLADREIPFAGHPTIATAASLLDRNRIIEETVTFETGAGVLSLETRRDPSGVPRVTMTQPAPVFGPEMPPDLIAAVGRIDAGDIVGVPRMVSTGLPTCVTLLASHDVLRRVRLDEGALAQYREKLTPDWRHAIEPFWVATGGATGEGDTFARMLSPPPNPAEDPFTGSATGAMAAHFWREGLIDVPRFVAEQGHWMGRPGRAEVEVLGPRNAIKGVRVGGRAYVLMRGTLEL